MNSDKTGFFLRELFDKKNKCFFLDNLREILKLLRLKLNKLIFSVDNSKNTLYYTFVTDKDKTGCFLII